MKAARFGEWPLHWLRPALLDSRGPLLSSSNIGSCTPPHGIASLYNLSYPDETLHDFFRCKELQYYRAR